MPLLLLVLGYLALSVTFHAATPPLEASDEGAHLGMVIYLRDHGRLPVLNRGEPLRFQNQEMTQAPLYYALSAWWIRGADLSDAEACLVPRPDSPVGRADRPGFKHIWQPQAAEGSSGTMRAVNQLRILSMLMGLGTVLLTWRLARTYWPDDRWAAFFAGSWVAFNPMFLFIANSVNNDNLVVLLATLSLYMLSCWPESKPSLRWPAGLGLLVGLAVLAKVSGLLLVPVAALALLTRSGSSWRHRWLSVVVLGVVAAAVCGWWFLRNQLLYGEWTASQLQSTLLGNGRPEMVPWALLIEWDGFVKSYWGVFGAFNVIYPDWVYYSFYGVSAAAVGLTCLCLVSSQLRPGWFPRVLLFFSVLNLAAVGYWTSMLWGSQGRLLFPSISAHALWWVMGWSRAQRAGRFVMALLSCLLFALAAWAGLRLIPASYPT